MTPVLRWSYKKTNFLHLQLHFIDNYRPCLPWNLNSDWLFRIINTQNIDITGVGPLASHQDTISHKSSVDNGRWQLHSYVRKPRTKGNWKWLNMFIMGLEQLIVILNNEYQNAHNIDIIGVGFFCKSSVHSSHITDIFSR